MGECRQKKRLHKYSYDLGSLLANRNLLACLRSAITSDLSLSRMLQLVYIIMANFSFWHNIHISPQLLHAQVFFNISHLMLELLLFFSLTFHTKLAGFVLFFYFASLREDWCLYQLILNIPSVDPIYIFLGPFLALQ